MTPTQITGIGRVEALTMRELSSNTADVIEQLCDEKTPRVITKHGRFQALLRPLEEGIESKIIAETWKSTPPPLPRHTGGVRAADLITRELESAPTALSTPADDVPSESSTKSPRTVSMAELNRQTASVIERVYNGQNLVLTKHGRFVALFSPLPKNIESLIVRHFLLTDPYFSETFSTQADGGIKKGLMLDDVQIFLDL